MLGGLLEREVTRDGPEWAAAVASLTVSEKVKIMPSRRQHKENERDCRTIVQQLVSSIPHEGLTSTSYGRKEQGHKVLSGELRWMLRTRRNDPEDGKCSIADSSKDDNSRNSGIDTYSDRNSSSGSELSELAIHALLVETRARNLDRQVYQDPDSDRYLIPGERVFDNAADDLETIAVSKRSISLLPQKEVVRTDIQPFEQETQPLAKIWCVKIEEDTHHQ